jgi:hypothetical protein
MTEAEWLAATDPKPMMSFLTGKASDRKLRLFLTASARLVWDRMPVGEMREAVEVAERYADGLASADQIDDYRGRFYGYVLRGRSSQQADWIRDRDKFPVFTLARMTTYTDQMARTLTTNVNWRDGIGSYHPFLPPIIRDVFGLLPFRPVAFDPAWRTSTVVALARQMYDSRDFSAMPILADALQDAGCDCADLLAHCRGDGPHVRGCWVADLVLGLS